MEIYRVTIETPYSGEVLESHFFATKEAATAFAETLKEDMDGEFDTLHEIVVTAYAPDGTGEFSYDHEIATYDI